MVKIRFINMQLNNCNILLINIIKFVNKEDFMDTFTYDSQNFLLNGQKVTILSGAIHYFRVVPDYWYDRLLKLKACGFNTVETVTCWNLHEKKEGQFDFNGILDIERFIKTAADLGLNVILRPGPYICAEWDFGGLPSWLLTYPKMRLRCYDEVFLSKVRRYYHELFNRVRPHLCTNGGNVIMVQIENEYGSYGNDKTYLQAIVDIYHENKVDCLLFTSDGPTYFMLNGGAVDEYLSTINFGNGVQDSFSKLRKMRPNQPVMCCEFWNGWFDHWYDKHHTREGDDTANVFDEMLSNNGSVNFYMFHGGTNFGFNNGANYEDGIQPTVTSYDYDCPISECGDITQKFYDVKAIVEKHFGKLPDIQIQNMPKIAYGDVKLTQTASLFENLNYLSTPMKCAYPMTMEELGQGFGYVLYSTTLKGPYEKLPLEIDGLHDRAIIYINGEFKGIKERTGKRWDNIEVELDFGEEMQVDILVENMGRINYGPKIRDEKGIIRGVKIGQQYHFGWTMYSIPCDDLTKIVFKPNHELVDIPTFLKGNFSIRKKADTFLRLDNFTKGIAIINGFNLGRYWTTAGPQKTLYLPAPLLIEGENELIIFELESSTENTVTFTDSMDLG